MKNKGTPKKTLRKKIAEIKQSYSQEQLLRFSDEVMENLEQSFLFRDAHTVFLYHSMPDEVNTHLLLQRYAGEKRFLLPVVRQNNLVLRIYDPKEGMALSSYGILEPVGADFLCFGEIDVTVVPGVAFDRKLNRMGRGKGFYDRLLPHIKSPKIGVCFDFQLLDNIPAEENDIKMDFVIAQNEIIL